ncbi:hypothetical protein I79_000428 [Cricetulus griseus]|uniref:Uncharacterized protein n=1 Tax=Cricetulus griseus TaxID=10029 RepID=G3GSB0_CRIGR|nr:hypothetical protein I79_000428 [Cricetulus griseus]
MPCEHSDRAVESATFAQGAQGGRKTHAQLRAPRPLFRRLLEPPANENVIVTQVSSCKLPKPETCKKASQHQEGDRICDLLLP